MVKTAALSIRVSPELKEMLDQRAAEEGVSVAAFAERALRVHAEQPAWKLADPEIYFSPARGAQVKLPVAVGWPVALVTLDHAEALGKELIKITEAGKSLPKGKSQ